ncbi:MAG TPA: hypothetical protein VFU73_02490 [Actinocrinis sp.]|nr:hypothetical protein [Actinocrinis sp.]
MSFDRNKKAASLTRLVAIAATMGATTTSAAAAAARAEPRRPDRVGDDILGSAARSHLATLVPASPAIRKAAAPAAETATTTSPFSQANPLAEAFDQADPFGEVFGGESAFTEAFSEGGGGVSSGGEPSRRPRSDHHD